jgi:glutaredoxin
VNAALRVFVVALILVGSSWTTSCRRTGGPALEEAGALSPVVRDDSEGLLLTWIDDKGDFHVETRVADVPMMGRDTVRVVDANRDNGSHTDIFVADFRQAGADGSYPVRAMSRADFEAIAVARRQRTGPTLASAAPATSRESPPSAGDAPAESSAKPLARVVVIIYGAEWCSACHDAARYLRRKGVAYVEKDIEKEPEAAREMQQKLASNGLRGGSIPVIDVRGKVMVGFDPGQIDAALGGSL